MKKKLILIGVLAFVVCTAFFSGCKKNKKDISADDIKNSKQNDKINVVCTIFPQYDWTRQIIKGAEEKFSLALLLGNGTDLHNYQPTASDMARLSSCDVFIYVGGESDEWVHDALKNSTNKDMAIVNLLDVLGENAKIEEMVEGMQEHEHHEGEEHDDEEEHEHHGHEEHDEETEYDEHVWLSLKNAKIFVNAISEIVSQKDKENIARYTENCEEYIKKLSDLDAQYEQAVSDSSKNVVLFGDRFPFRYMVDDYNLDYYAAFSGCSAESEASFKTIVFLSGKVDELGLSSVLVIEGSDKKIAQSIISNTADKDMKILTLNSLQSITKSDVANGADYLSVMTDNLKILKQALN